MSSPAVIAESAEEPESRYCDVRNAADAEYPRRAAAVECEELLARAGYSQERLMGISEERLIVPGRGTAKTISSPPPADAITFLSEPGPESARLVTVL